MVICFAYNNYFRQYTAWSESVNEIADLNNWLALSKLKLELPSQADVLKGFKYVFEPLCSSHTKYSTKVRYQYLYSTLRNVTDVKLDYIAKAEAYVKAYEKDW